MKKLLPLLLLVLVACQAEQPQDTLPTRGLTPWVFRSVLDQQARMLTVALHKDLFIAYSAETGALYKAWKGDVDLDGAVYTTAHGPQPEAIGRVWLKNETVNPWKVVPPNGTPLTPSLQYKGHRIEEGQVYLSTTLAIPGQNITVTVMERPEFLTGLSGQIGLERRFSVVGLPKGYTLQLQTSASSLPSVQSLETNGKWLTIGEDVTSIKNLRAVSLHGSLTLQTDEPTYLRSFFIRYPVFPDDNASADQLLADNRQPGEKLIERNGCKTCHNKVVKTIGPAYNTIAERYTNTTANLEKLTAKVIKGGSGTWGSAAMTPHDHIPPADVRTMVQWVLDLDKDSEATMVEEDPASIFSADQ
ncbi:MAG: c-type cytochrome, partial [Bacteroidota bacterium]